MLYKHNNRRKTMDERYKVWQQFEATGEISHKPTNTDIAIGYAIEFIVCFCILFVLPYIALLMTE